MRVMLTSLKVSIYTKSFLKRFKPNYYNPSLFIFEKLKIRFPHQKRQELKRLPSYISWYYL